MVDPELIPWLLQQRRPQVLVFAHVCAQRPQPPRRRLLCAILHSRCMVLKTTTSSCRIPDPSHEVPRRRIVVASCHLGPFGFVPYILPTAHAAPTPYFQRLAFAFGQLERRWLVYRLRLFGLGSLRSRCCGVRSRRFRLSAARSCLALAGVHTCRDAAQKWFHQVVRC